MYKQIQSIYYADDGDADDDDDGSVFCSGKLTEVILFQPQLESPHLFSLDSIMIYNEPIKMGYKSLVYIKR